MLVTGVRRGTISRRICNHCHSRLPALHNGAQCYSQRRLPASPARTRFAPSPTGNLHLGSVRTALYNYLLARRTKGQFVLRVEDTDEKRTVPGAEERLFEDLRWAGLQCDEGPVVGGQNGPYRQSERTHIYASQIQLLLQSGHAYRCFCSAERLNQLNRSRHEQGLNLGYDRKCADVPQAESGDRAHQGQPHVVRFKVPAEYPTYTDLVYGKSGRNLKHFLQGVTDEDVYDDPILIKSDGHPTYHFANVVDDHLMQITHVIRGAEWSSSTPLHVALYSAFGWTPPLFGHVPLLVDENRQKLSKRDNAADLSRIKEQGILPDALVNFAALLGWSHTQRSDVMSLAELETVFDLKFTKGNTIVKPEKLLFLQRKHVRRHIQDGGPIFEQMVGTVVQQIRAMYTQAEITNLLRGRKLDDVVGMMLRADSNSFSSPQEFAQQCGPYLTLPKARELEVDSTSVPVEALSTAALALCLLPNESWTAAEMQRNIAALEFPAPSPAGQRGPPSRCGTTDFYRYLRAVLLGGASTPGIYSTMEILGRDICTQRIQEAAQRLQSSKSVTAVPRVDVSLAAG